MQSEESRLFPPPGCSGLQGVSTTVYYYVVYHVVRSAPSALSHCPHREGVLAETPEASHTGTSLAEELVSLVDTRESGLSNKRPVLLSVLAQRIYSERLPIDWQQRAPAEVRPSTRLLPSRARAPRRVLFVLHTAVCPQPAIRFNVGTRHGFSCILCCHRRSAALWLAGAHNCCSGARFLTTKAVESLPFQLEKLTNMKIVDRDSWSPGLALDSCRLHSTVAFDPL